MPAGRRCCNEAGVRRLIVVAGLIAALLASTAGWVVWDFTHFLNTPLHLHKPRLVSLKPGMSVRAFAGELVRDGVLSASRDARYLDWYSRFTGAAERLKAGQYQLLPGMRPRGLLALLDSGKVYQHRLTIVEGWTFQRMLQLVEHAPGLRHTLAADTPAQVMKALGHPGQPPQGRFFPDTYYYQQGMSDVQFLQRAYRKMKQVLARQWKKRAAGLPYHSSYAALTLASIVEKETADPQGRAKVAGVFVRRLERGMRLEADPTVIYALGKSYNGNITAEDLYTKSAYNTYRHAGLPPTPICLPGKAAIHAALHPAAGKSLYFVSTGEGYHVFSDTLAQHDRQVRKYQLHEH